MDSAADTLFHYNKKLGRIQAIRSVDDSGQPRGSTDLAADTLLHYDNEIGRIHDSPRGTSWRRDPNQRESDQKRSCVGSAAADLAIRHETNQEYW
ncbi:hypothetical protein PGT21_010422 [Puccinia graminis f. sp. tritici]|uniref:Uncharacterized protein n=1 Tax=Puccinia graminis f. sp. tritici TaxID=56615 RepID=A0A5B0P6Q3_PUCGR|nr:hypothetical protein PGT21_010422 [Puccinia graminis f. sp. tritici]KAA1099123.1 hypothetical protein PGTUg99_023643 [Puccinia graminis f. sp. tritici]